MVWGCGGGSEANRSPWAQSFAGGVPVPFHSTDTYGVPGGNSLWPSARDHLKSYSFNPHSNFNQ